MLSVGRLFVAFFAIVSVTQSRGGTFFDQHGAAIQAAVKLYRAASFYPGIGHFEVQANVIAVEAQSDKSVQVRLRTRGRWMPIDKLGYASDPEEERPVRELRWTWPPAAGPVPVAQGMEVSVQLTPSGEILRLGYSFEAVRAYRRLPDGQWELVLKDMDKGYLLRLAPRAFDPSGIEVRWTKPHGLTVGEFGDGEYGADGADESESATVRRLGWPIANQPGERILPGRDGWQRWNSNTFAILDPESKLRWFAAEVPPSQWWLDEKEAEHARSLSSRPLEKRED